MNKLLAAFFITLLALPNAALAVPFDSELPGNPADQKAAALNNTANQISALTETANVLNCSQDGNFGGALSNAIGVGLQKGIPGLINKIGGGFIGDLAAKAGPFSGLVNTLGKIGLDKLSSAALDIVGSIFPDAASVAAGAAGQAVGAALGVAGIPGVGGGKVPVIDDAAIAVQKSIDSSGKNIDKSTATLTYKECVIDPTEARLKNAVLSTLTSSLGNWVTNGFEGGPSFATALQGLAKDASAAILERVEDEVLSGICSPLKQEVQQAVLTQYQYTVNVGEKVQCKDKGQLQQRIAGEWDNGGGWSSFYENIFSNEGLTTYLKAQDAATDAISSGKAELFTNLNYGNGSFPVQDCTDSASIPVQGGVCINGKVTVPAKYVSELGKKVYVDLPQDQLMNADEIGEIVDSLMAGLTQTVFQSIDGLFSASKKQKTTSGSSVSYLDQVGGVDGGGSYLDTLADTASGGSLDAARSALLNDMRGVESIEKDYQDILNDIIDNLSDTKKNYTDVVACYQKLTTSISGSISTATAGDRMNQASSTVAQLITPQIKSFQQQLSFSEDATDELDLLMSEAESVQTIADLNAVAASYQSLITRGAVHTSTDLTFLQNDLAAGAVALKALNTDAKDKLRECRQY